MEAGNAIACGVRKALPESEAIVVPVADGGEGTTEALCGALSGEILRVKVRGPLGESVVTEYAIAEGGTAIIEMSQASGLPLISKEERNPLLTSTFGTGEMILDAIRRGCRKFLVGIGGSATNDGGTGMLSALGFRFLDKEGRPLEGCGASLGKIAEIDCSGVAEELADCRFTVACDVDTPFCGPKGATRVFSPQKGADPEAVEELENGMRNFADLVERSKGISLHSMPGSGAAGGLGGAFSAFLGAELKPGVDMVLDAVDFSKKIEGASLVITGEGKTDSQTLKGKTPAGVLAYASRIDIPVVVLCGKVEDAALLEESDFAAVFPIVPGPCSLEEAMKEDKARENLRRTAFNVAGIFKNQSK